MSSYNEGMCATGAGARGFFVGILLGAVIGGVVALLYAPKAGPETREMLNKRMEEWKGKAGQVKEVLRSSPEQTT